MMIPTGRLSRRGIVTRWHIRVEVLYKGLLGIILFLLLRLVHRVYSSNICALTQTIILCHIERGAYAF